MESGHRLEPYKIIEYGGMGEIEEKTILLKVDGDVKLRVDKSSIVRDPSDNVQK